MDYIDCSNGWVTKYFENVATHWIKLLKKELLTSLFYKIQLEQWFPTTDLGPTIAPKK